MGFGIPDSIDDRIDDPVKVEDAERLKLDNLPLMEVMARARDAFMKDLAAKAVAGTLTKEDKVVLRNLLKDNGMTMAPAPSGLPAPERPGALPDLPQGYL